MFSKPIMIAASVAAANATLLTASAGTHAATVKSDATGCGKCLRMTASGNFPTFAIGGATIGTATAGEYLSPTASTTVAVVSEQMTGDICCGDGGTSTTQESSGTTTVFCTKAAVTYASDKKHSTFYLAATDFVQSALAKCPHNTTYCGYAGKKKDTTTAIAAAVERYIKVEDQGSIITLSMKHETARGTAPSLKQRQGDVCTWIVETKCDAPVLTVKTGSGVITSGTPEWFIQVLEWDEEFLGTATWAAADYTGLSTCKFYPKLANDNKIVDLMAAEPVVGQPNNLMGDVSFKIPVTTGTNYLNVPGNTLVNWMANIKAVYDAYDADVVKYNAENVIWKKYAEYSAPAPGLFDWLFGATEDPDKPKAASSPLQPTQPVAAPATIASLAISVTATTSKAEYKALGGYGYPSAYMLIPVATKTVKPFGTLAGAGILKTTAVAAVAGDSLMSVRKTANYDATGATAITACKKSYLMITGVIDLFTKTVELQVTTSAWQKTLEQQIPTRPGAVTAPVAAPAGASQLAASAVAAALTALYLF